MTQCAQITLRGERHFVLFVRTMSHVEVRRYVRGHAAKTPHAAYSPRSTAHPVRSAHGTTEQQTLGASAYARRYRAVWPSDAPYQSFHIERRGVTIVHSSKCYLGLAGQDRRTTRAFVNICVCDWFQFVAIAFSQP